MPEPTMTFADEEKSRRIHSIKVENYKGVRLIFVDLDDKGNYVPVTGNNGAGKSSFLDAAAFGLAGAKWKVEKPIRLGEKKAIIEVTLDDGMLVRRTITPSGSPRLEIICPDGTPYRGEPQKFLESIIGRISFDPFEYARLSVDEKGRKKQVDMLLIAVGKDEEAKQLDADIKRVYEERRIANSDVDRAQGVLNGIAVVPHGTPDAEVDVARLSEELEGLIAGNRESEDLQREVDANKREAERLQSEIDRLNLELEAVKKTGNELFMKQLEVGQPANIEPQCEVLRGKIRDAGATNKIVQQKRSRSEKAKVLAELQVIARDKDDLLTNLRAKKEDLLKGCDLPIEGLTISDDGLMLNGVPFDQIATSQKIRISTALSHAINPKFPVMFIRDASLLDADSRRWFKDYADEHDLQMLVELVGDGADKSVGIYIEAGEIV